MTQNVQRKYKQYISGVLVGSTLLSIGIFVLLAYLHRVLNTQQYADFAMFWSLSAGLVVGICAPLETAGLTVYRTDKKIHAHDVQSLLKLGFRNGAIVIGLLGVVGVALKNRFPIRYESLLVCLVIVIVGYTFTYSSRGFLIASGSTGKYGALMAAEGFARIVFCLTLATIWRISGVLAALCVAIVSLWAGLVHRRFVNKLSVADEMESKSINARELNLLVLSSVGFLGLANAEPIVAYVWGNLDGTGNLLNALSIARSPLMLVAALQALVIPIVVHNRSGDGKHPIRLRNLIVAAFIFLTGFASFFVFTGNALLSSIFGGESNFSYAMLALLVATPCFLLFGTLAQSILVVAKDYLAIAQVWLIGLLVFLIGLAAPGSDLFRIVFSGFVSGLFLVLAFSIRITFMIKARRL